MPSLLRFDCANINLFDRDPVARGHLLLACVDTAMGEVGLLLDRLGAADAAAVRRWWSPVSAAVANLLEEVGSTRAGLRPELLLPAVPDGGTAPGAETLLELCATSACRCLARFDESVLDTAQCEVLRDAMVAARQLHLTCRELAGGQGAPVLSDAGWFLDQSGYRVLAA